MTEQRPFVPSIGERALIVGQTGSGKTAFALFLLVRITTSPVILYDTKEEQKFPNLPNSIIVESIEEAHKRYDDPQVDYIIIRPHIEILSKPNELDAMLLYHYNHFRHSTAYIDEAYSFHNNGRAGPGIVALYTRGRSRGITTILSTQRPAMISRFCITEAQKAYIFFLADKDDRRRISDVIPNYQDYPNPKKHSFYFFESGEEEAHLFKPIKLDPALDTGYVDLQMPESEAGNTVEHPFNPIPGTKHVWI